uniref:Uncharacterized protein n=1 Tax=Oryza rufipogon TaxID=4529 RepID=A0A0E0PSU0_ORYRU
MAETVLSMARFMNDELKTMQAFLIAAETMKKKDLLLKVWAEQVRSLSYDIEDCLEEFMVHVGNQSLLQQLTNLKDRHRIAVKIRNLKSRLEEVSSRNTRYNSIKMEANNTFDEIESMEDVRNHSRSNIDEAKLVGFDTPKKELLDKINMDANDDDHCRVLCVVGMGGLGKTTLVRKIFENHWEWIREFALPSKNNKRSRVIVTTRLDGVANACTTEPFVYRLKLLETECAIDLLLRKMGESKEDMKNDNNLKSIVTQVVKKCGCLPLAIVTIGAMFANKPSSKWEEMCRQLPSELESNPSPGVEAIRRVVTLSYGHLPSHLKPCYLYLSIFPEDIEIKRRHLVNRWVAEGLVRARVGMTISDVGESYFDELISRSMIQPSRVNMEGHVKSCLVHDIMRDIIVSISKEENFVYSTGDNVSTVIVEKFRHLSCHGGNYPIVGMDFSRVRSLTVFGEFDQRPMLVGSSICSAQFTMLRVLDLENAVFSVTQKDINKIGLLRHLRYLNTHTRRRSTIYALPSSIGKLQNLQVLDIRDSEISTLPTDISKLLMLRILRCSKRARWYFYFDPDEPIKCLKHTLRMPLMLTPLVGSAARNNTIAELHRAYSSHWSETQGVRVPTGISKLKELQVLEVVDLKLTKSKAIEELGELRWLQKLRVTTKGAQDKKRKTLCEAIEKLSSLQSLCVYEGYYFENGTLEWLGPCNFSPPPLLRKLELYGRIRVMPDSFRNLKQLRKIFLRLSELDGRAIEILGTLPNLMLLNLDGRAYVGNELAFKKHEFPNLKELRISMLSELRGIRFEKDALPHMERMEIEYCQLRSGIVGIKHLQKIKEISLGDSCKVAGLDLLEEEVKAHPNKPALQLHEDRSTINLGSPVVLTEDQGSSDEGKAKESVHDDAGESSGK